MKLKYVVTGIVYLCFDIATAKVDDSYKETKYNRAYNEITYRTAYTYRLEGPESSFEWHLPGIDD